ncbi:MAG: hypothetical protein ACYTEQ_00915 [Planctomycetota bacterium]|jgi:hypothetical protein
MMGEVTRVVDELDRYRHDIEAGIARLRVSLEELEQALSNLARDMASDNEEGE